MPTPPTGAPRLERLERHLTPGILYKKGKTEYPCRCWLTFDFFKFFQGPQLQLLVSERLFQFHPACRNRTPHLFPKAPPGWDLFPDYVVVVIGRHGLLQGTLDGRPFRLPPGSLMAINPGQRWHPKSVPAGQTHLRWLALGFHLQMIRTIQEHAGVVEATVPALSSSPAPLPPAMRLAVTLLEQGLARMPQIGSTIVVESAATQILACLLQERRFLAEGVPPPSLTATTRDPRIQKALAYLVTHHHTSVTTRELSVLAGLSQSHLFTLFHTEVGMSPQQYLLRYRLRRGVDLLQTTALSVKEISRLTGFQDPNQFSRMFRRHFQRPPKAYRGSPVPPKRERPPPQK